MLTESVECEHEAFDVGEVEFEIRHLLVAFSLAFRWQRHVLDQFVVNRRHLNRRICKHMMIEEIRLQP